MGMLGINSLLAGDLILNIGPVGLRSAIVRTWVNNVHAKLPTCVLRKEV